MDAIRIEGLKKRYVSLGKTKVALDGIDLNVEPREVFGFLGRNGAGKTTTIKTLCGLLKPSAGQAWIFGESARAPRARRHIGYLPELPYFYDYLTPRETIAFYARLRRLDAAERARTWDGLSELFDLRSIADQRVRGFSKGMRQRLGFAVALVGDPPLLILDEPMSGLDPIGRRMIREIILRLRDEQKTIFFSSHVLADVEQICDRVAIVRDGKITKQGRLDQLLGQQVQEVEIVAEKLETPLAAQLAADATRHRTLEEQQHFVFGSEAAADAAIAAIIAGGGRVVSVTPLRERLEDYFLREQGGELSVA